MSNSKMLIDATHPEETRVVVQRNGRVEEFDFESAARKLLRGNIYLAKVTRVEPSLQAAFVDYGGNRQGFLAFNEIHPDYYQIPVADRQALIEEEAAAEAELEAAADRRAEALARRAGGRQQDSEGYGQREPNHDEGGAADEGSGDDGVSNIVDVEEDEHIEEVGGEAGDDDAPQTFAAPISGRDERISEPALPAAREAHEHDGEHRHGASEGHDHHDHGSNDHKDEGHEPHHHSDGEHHADEGSDHSGHDDPANGAEDAGGPDDLGASESRPALGGRGRRRGSEGGDDMSSRPRRRPRSYKIQEVIKRRQVILVQVVKEERGNKGAALTTYLSLAGRYTVLMPNTARGGGISRKITQPQDRKRLKAIAQELEVPEGMGLIIRTAGAARTKQEIKRDFEYLLRLWESVRDLTLQSTAPSLVYEEGDLIKRSIRDLYNKDVEEVVVAGEAGYHEAHGFMHMLMPSHAKNVINYKDPTPLFPKYGTERQLNAMFLPQVTLRSGGYIVINQTEALVAIDVNSGKSTREFSIEETALATNLEASDEIARQLKLRDLAGLIVIDFIDMEEKRNNRAVERRLKDALRHDRARIQLGRISHFGLMEMSRQRLRTGVLEGSTSQCPHCQGTGIIRSTESIALAVLRGLEDAITAGAQAPLVATTTPAVALYILNGKRPYVTEMEARHGYTVTILGSDRIQGANFTVERGVATAMPTRRPERAAVNMDWGFEGEEEDAGAPSEGGEIVMAPEDGDDEAPMARGKQDGGGENGDGRHGKRRRRRRGGRRERGEEGPRQDFQASPEDEDSDETATFGAGENSHSAGQVTGEDGPEVDTDDGAETEAGTEGDNGEKRGRRRRRGRRGGRRGRGDRDGLQAPPEGFVPGPVEAHNDTDAANVPGMEPQPVVPQAASMGSAAAERNSSEPRRSERPRPERIWDAPSEPRAHERAHDRAQERVDEPVARELRPEPKPEARAHHELAAAVAPRRPEMPVAEPEAPLVPARPRHETGSSEPRVERVVLKPDQIADGAAETPAAPQRKGWWQRRFSGE